MYVHLFTFLEHVTAVLFSHPEAETQVRNWKKMLWQRPLLHN